MLPGKTPLLLAAAALASGCSSPPELTGAAAARARGASVRDGEPPEASPGPEAAGPSRPSNPWLEDAKRLACVNGKVVTLREVRQVIGPAYESYMAFPEGLARVVEIHTRDLVLRALVVDEGKRLGLAVADEDMEEDEDRERRKAEKAGSTLEQEIRDSGMSRHEWEESRREKLLYRRSLGYMAGFWPDRFYSEEHFRPRVDSYVSPGDVRTWGERNRSDIDRPATVTLRILYLSAEDHAGEGVSAEEAQARCAAAADALLARFRAGEPFAKLAAEGRPYPGAGEGGLLGPIRVDDPFPAQCREWAFAPVRKPGDVSDPIRRPGGALLVLHLESKEEASRPDIEEWGGGVRAFLEDRRRDLALAELYARLLEEGCVSPPELRDSLLAEAREKARKIRRELEPPEPPSPVTVR